MTGDEITLTIPREQPFHEVAHLVLGGVAARLEPDLREHRRPRDGARRRARAGRGDGEVTVELRLDEHAIVTRVGPFAADALREELDATTAASASAGSSTPCSTATRSTATAGLR
jgi:hypothetical protein